MIYGCLSIWSLIQSTGVTDYHLSLIYNGTYLRSTNSKLSATCLSLALEFIEGGGDRSCFIDSAACSALRSQLSTLIDGLDYNYGLG